MGKKDLGYAVISLFFLPALVLSFFRREYTENLAHAECNNAIIGFFNKSLNSTHYVCTVDGSVVHAVDFTPHSIPGPVLMVGIFSCFILVVELGPGLLDKIMEKVQRWVD